MPPVAREGSSLTLWSMEALTGWLHPAKEKITKEEVQEEN